MALWHRTSGLASIVRNLWLFSVVGPNVLPRSPGPLGFLFLNSGQRQLYQEPWMSELRLYYFEPGLESYSGHGCRTILLAPCFGGHEQR